ncbi:phosphate transport system regulator PhoU [Spiroplasma sp. TIUS-1]|uniref:PhoU domain-containing protein n=1 Tax=Spiroplasma sp. TIUS-1 TaxID=216963 RepID=UPI001397A450|nr:PhoU domain-containing protein [Spiroplasma sp. TIUS-1]QHX35788.1 phosphate transport system regulator PhoU [Spiroplasma sp. TIUS-1]
MAVNKILDNDIKQIKKELNLMIEKTKEQFRLTFASLVEKDIELCKLVIEKDLEINKLQNEFIKQAQWKIAKQHMVASDLRLAIGSIMIARDLERTADVAKHICQYLVKYKPENIAVEYISSIFETTMKMFNEVATHIENPFENRKTEAVQQQLNIAKAFDELYNKLVENVAKDNRSETILTNFRMVRRLRDLEHVGEYLLGIEESIVFIKSGKFEEIQKAIIEEVNLNK